MSRYQERILQTLREQGPMTTRAVADMIGAPLTRTSVAMRGLVRFDMVEIVDTIGRRETPVYGVVEESA